MSWWRKKEAPEERPPSKYRIVPKGSEDWGIQLHYGYGDEGYKDVVVIYHEFEKPFCINKHDYWGLHKRKEDNPFSTGTMDECKSIIDKLVERDKKADTIEARENDKSLYLDYP